MLASNITHAASPIEHGRIVHSHGRSPARHDKLSLVTDGMVVFVRVTESGQLHTQRAIFLFGMYIKKVLQFEQALVRDSVLPELGDFRRRHPDFLPAILCVALFRLKRPTPTRLFASKQFRKESHSD